MISMTAAEKDFFLPAGSRIGIVAGGGRLPVELAKSLAEQHHSPFIVIAQGEVDRLADFDPYDREILALEDIGSLVPTLKRHGVTHLVLAGEIKRRPKLGAMRFNLGLLGWLPSVVAGLAVGDNALLSILVRGLERRGIRMVGAHEAVPSLVAVEGVWTRAKPSTADRRDIQAAFEAAKAIGRLDIGQAAVAIGGRVVALEGVEGTNGLLERVKEIRTHGRLAGKNRGVLVKCVKPGQELRADLPSIGEKTVDAAHEAGLAGIAVEAGRSLVLDGPGLVAKANGLGLFVLGLPSPEVADGG